jgi:hypothetical protein
LDDNDVNNANNIVNNIFYNTQDVIQQTTDQIKKFRRSYTKATNAYQDQGICLAEGIIDSSIESQKKMIELFESSLRNNPFIDPSVASTYISAIEKTGEAYAKILIATLQNNTAVLRIGNNANSTNLSTLNIFLDQLKYATRQWSNITVNALRVSEGLKRFDETIIEKEENRIRIERYIHAEFPKQMSLNDNARLVVNIKTTPPASSLISSPKLIQGVGQIRINAPPGRQEVRLLVYFNQEDPSFDINDKEYCKEIIVPVNDQDTQPIIFNLRPKKEGDATIRLEFFKEGVGGYIGELTLNTIIFDPEKPVTQSIEYPKSFELIKTGRFFDDVSAPHPDMTLLILQTKSYTSSSEYQVYLSSQEMGICPMGTIPLEMDIKSKFRNLFKEIEKTNLSPNVIDENIKSIGYVLYEEIFPSELKKIYWHIRDKIQSIQVWSMEPWIPWEIIKPWSKLENGTIEEDKFLCERFAFCRWRIGIAPVIKDQLRKIRVIVPSDTKLKKAFEERDWIKEFARNKGMSVSFASSREEVMSTFRSGDFDVLHFSTHGTHNNNLPILSVIVLENGEEITPGLISGMALTFGQVHPLVILNACQSGVQDFSFTEIQGWAKRFLDAGASAFICTLWPVSDETALKFTQELYNQLSEGVSLGEAVRAARLKCKKMGDPSWLAYELYGHPNMKVKFPNR